MQEIWNTFAMFFKEYILDTVKAMRLTDFFDILILALILYYVYSFIRDRRAGKLALGLVLIVALFFLSSALNMYALNFIFDNFLQVGIIAILIVFQPEMRAALEKVGGTPFSGLKNITSESGKLAALNSQIEGICNAASDLSRDKVGALIVIERTTKLGEYIKSGVIIDAAVSPYILRNIFFNKAPLHDGATIIRDGRVYAAGCFLPLSTNYDIDKDLGTRHRAAIGLTEISDAVVIVISEETGIISVSVNGNLKRNYNYSTLKQELNTLLAPQNQGEQKQKKHRKESK
ncbi:MAG: diadenylate cyclase CdaA [Clostridia bacterium]|nr:diadenylate cyclase CdaA [Clostridia bacterium]